MTLSPPSRSGRKRSARAHRAVIDATVELLREVGLQQLTIEGVAARAGVAKATVYRWWPTKAALAVETLGEQLGEPLQPTGDTKADVRAMVAVLVESVGGLLGEVLIADLSRDQEAGAQLQSMFGVYRAAHGAILLGAAGRGDLPHDVDVTKVIDLVCGMALFQRVMGRGPDDELIDQLTALILSGELPRIEWNRR